MARFAIVAAFVAALCLASFASAEEASNYTALAVWNRANCSQVANAWLNGKVYYFQKPTTKQYVTYGKGLYRSDCSGFVSAAWNLDPPGATTYTLKYSSISKASLQRCDILMKTGHVALFWGFAKDGSAMVVEEYMTGKTAELRTWSSSRYAQFSAGRRPGW